MKNALAKQLERVVTMWRHWIIQNSDKQSWNSYGGFQYSIEGKFTEENKLRYEKPKSQKNICGDSWIKY